MNTYEQNEVSIEAMKKIPDVKEVLVSAGKNCWRFLINPTCNRAVMLHSVCYPTKPHGRGSRMNPRFAADEACANRCCTVSMGRRGIQQFFSSYHEYHLVVSVGRIDHGTCLFIHRSLSSYEFLWYNPNKNQNLNTNAKNLMDDLCKTGVHRSLSYNDPDDNPHGKCSELVWVEMHEFLAGRRGNMPTDDELLKYNTKLKKYE